MSYSSHVFVRFPGLCANTQIIFKCSKLKIFTYYNDYLPWFSQSKVHYKRTNRLFRKVFLEFEDTEKSMTEISTLKCMWSFQSPPRLLLYHTIFDSWPVSCTFWQTFQFHWWVDQSFWMYFQKHTSRSSRYDVIRHQSTSFYGYGQTKRS